MPIKLPKIKLINLNAIFDFIFIHFALLAFLALALGIVVGFLLIKIEKGKDIDSNPKVKIIQLDTKRYQKVLKIKKELEKNFQKADSSKYKDIF